MKPSYIYIIIVLLLLIYPNPCIAANADTCRGQITFDSTYVISVNKSLPKYYIRLIEKEDTSGEYTEWKY